MPASSQSRSNAAASGYEARQRGGGGKLGEHHKTSIDALLNPKHAGAQPYRLVLGDVRASHYSIAYAQFGANCITFMQCRTRQ